jgi:magnesium-protoporphyrin IX monomethyl ester (oxidative) cyclase
MKKSGCYQINFALESGNQYVLDNIIKKPLNLEKVKPFVKYAKDIGLDVGLFLVIGMPGETEQQMWDSFHLAEELEIYFPHISIATPYPGSELYEICKKKKYLKRNFSLDDLYIRSFPIITENWNDKKLEKILADGQKYLLISYIKKHSISFLKIVISKFLREPLRISKKLFNLLATRDWVKIR